MSVEINNRVSCTRRTTRGFTLVEIMIVVGIIGVLAGIAIPAFQKARLQARISRVKNDLRVLSSAIDKMAFDTMQWPGGLRAGDPANPEIRDLSADSAGLVFNDSGTFTRWNGPYIDVVPEDPRDSDYFFDPDYRIDGQDYAVVGSFGPNKDGPNVYDVDNIYILMQ
jgi:prepilin-type N-terminal cleavage/methylation domain-containing protein